MRIGTFHLLGSPDLARGQRRFEETIEQIALADELGFDYAWVAEHHFSNYGLSTNPLLLIAHASAVAPRIRFSQGVIVTPFWHPLRLAEDVAVVDILTRGRLDLGLGRGYQAMEFHGLNVPLEESRAIFQEQLALMKKAWTEDDFTFQGRYYQVPRPTTLLPKPLQRPHPPIWVATLSLTTLDWIAANGYQALITGNRMTWDEIAAWRDRFLTLRAAAGHRTDDARIGVLRHIYVADNEAEARAAVWQTRWQSRVSHHLGMDDEPIRAGRNLASPLADEPDDEAWWERLIYGTPERCIAQLRRDAEAGITDVLGWFDVGGLPHEQVVRSLRLFAQEVLPALAEAGVGAA